MTEVLHEAAIIFSPFEARDFKDLPSGFPV